MPEIQKKDILEYLQCMVNTETPTPLKIVNQMLDLIPNDVWLDDNAKILCPACKDGIFLREAVIRILRAKHAKLGGYEFGIRQNEILNQILRKRIFGIAISYRGYRVTKRTLYTCRDDFSDIDNIFFDETLGEYVKDKSGNSVERQSFHFIKNQNEVSNFFASKGVENMKFDVIIGNPPYQENDGGGTGDSAKPIYQYFVQQAISLSPKYLCMIIPSRWMKGGKGLNKFREQMMDDTNIKYIYDYANAKECFPNINLDGGVSYFLWDYQHNAKTTYTYKPIDETEFTTIRFLREKNCDTVVRDARQLSIINKTKSDDTFESVVSSRKPYGLSADFFNHPDRYPNIIQHKENTKGLIKVYGVKGKKGGARRTCVYIDSTHIPKHHSGFDNYKLFFSKAYMTTSTTPPEIILGNPYEICTETFLQIGAFKTEQEAQNCLKYIHTKFFRALLFYNRHSLNISKESFSLIPLLNFRKEWTDKELYEQYKLTEEEIAFIEQQIKPMD